MTMQQAALSCFIKPADAKHIEQAFFCLAFVRTIVQRAYGITWNEFYGKVVDQRVDRNNGQPSYWIARDAERSMRAKWAIRPGTQKPGDIVFKWDTAKNKYGIFEGHIGVYLGSLLFLENGQWVAREAVIENARPEWRKTLANKGNIVISDFEAWPAVTTYVRLPDSKDDLLA